MSRIGRLPVVIPSGVEVNLQGTFVRVKGPKGELQRTFPPRVSITLEDGKLMITRRSDAPEDRALHGTTRAVLANMVQGVSAGFEKRLQLEGVGYRAEMDGQTLVLYVGYSHPMRVTPPADITFAVEKNEVIVRGIDKEKVGQVAADIRSIRPPEPYHGKGIRYAGEQIRRKAGKSGKGGK